eukprot:TCALIF_03148-PA protein Name:"Protein of unknown function" AED:0.25 eAED:0.25 QI:0/0/0/0.5/0/0.5/2/0/83
MVNNNGLWKSKSRQCLASIMKTPLKFTYSLDPIHNFKAPNKTLPTNTKTGSTLRGELNRSAMVGGTFYFAYYVYQGQCQEQSH